MATLTMPRYRAGMFGCNHAPLVLPTDVVRELAARYAEPHRAYHTAEHIENVLQWYDKVADGPGWRAPADVYLAVVFHDAVYDAKAKDNEVQSAQLARALVGANDRVVELIELTARHGSLTVADVAHDHDAAHFLDSDMAIIGAPPEDFDRYDEGVRFEYSFVPPDAYRAGRGAFLAKVAALPRIFFTPYFHDRLDAAARANIARALARLAEAG